MKGGHRQPRNARRSSAVRPRRERRTSRRQATALERTVRALALYKLGWTQDRIAAEVGYVNRSGANKAIRRGLALDSLTALDTAEAIRAEQVPELRAIQGLLMESLVRTRSGSERAAAAQAYVRASERLARLVGADQQPDEGRGTTVNQLNVFNLSQLSDEQLAKLDALRTQVDEILRLPAAPDTGRDPR